VRLHVVTLSLVFVVLAAGCGGASQPKLGHDDAARLIALTDRIAVEDPCAQAHDIAGVNARAIQLVNQGRVPAKLQEPLLAGVNALAAHDPHCVQPTAPPAPVLQSPKLSHRPHGHRPKHGKHGHDD
jgi:hypothetical protein